MKTDTLHKLQVILSVLVIYIKQSFTTHQSPMG